MGHGDVHFLTRLQRLESSPQVEFAMSLYRDRPLVQRILALSKLPAGLTQVAFSLDHPEKGPFVLVSVKDGAFVGCLPEGSAPEPGQKVITREELDAMAEEFAEIRDKLARAKGVAERSGRLLSLAHRLFELGSEFGREEFAEVNAFQPILGKQFTVLLAEFTKLEEKARPLCLELFEKKGKKYYKVLESYYHGVWAIGHLTPLTLAASKEWVDQLTPAEQPNLAGFCYGALVQGVAPITMRACWTSAAGGPGLLPGLEKLVQDEGTDDLLFLGAAASMACVALKHRSEKERVRKYLKNWKHPDPESQEALAQFTSSVVKGIDQVLADPETFTKQHLMLGRKYVCSLSKSHPVGSPWRFEKEEDVPEDLALTGLAHCPMDQVMPESKGNNLVLTVLPWLARVRAEQMYFPEEFLVPIRRPWTPEATAGLLRHWADEKGPPVKKTEETPGRNDPCPCGSGKKYKRCHGA